MGFASAFGFASASALRRGRWGVEPLHVLGRVVPLTGEELHGDVAAVPTPRLVPARIAARCQHGGSENRKENVRYIREIDAIRLQPGVFAIKVTNADLGEVAFVEVSRVQAIPFKEE